MEHRAALHFTAQRFECRRRDLPVAPGQRGRVGGGLEPPGSGIAANQFQARVWQRRCKPRGNGLYRRGQIGAVSDFVQSASSRSVSVVMRDSVM
jgi:hypothetical protein